MEAIDARLSRACVLRNHLLTFGAVCRFFALFVEMTYACLFIQRLMMNAPALDLSRQRSTFGVCMYVAGGGITKIS